MGGRSAFDRIMRDVVTAETRRVLAERERAALSAAIRLASEDGERGVSEPRELVGMVFGYLMPGRADRFGVALRRPGGDAPG